MLFFELENLGIEVPLDGELRRIWAQYRGSGKIRHTIYTYRVRGGPAAGVLLRYLTNPGAPRKSLEPVVLK